jgi:chromosome partitioning protein
MIIVTAALKGGVGKTTTSVYLAALASSNRRTSTLIDADPQGSAADWIAESEDGQLNRIEIAEAPTERLLNKALERARIVIIPTRVGGVETPRVKAVMELVPDGVPAGLVICSARTYTRSYQDAMQQYAQEGIPVWGTIPERVSITAGPTGPLAVDGLESYKKVWRKILAAARS